MGIVVPVLQHDYSIEWYNRESRAFEFAPLFKIGTEYPVPPDSAKRCWVKGSHHGQTRIGLKIFEVSRIRRRNVTDSIVGENGALKDVSRVASQYDYICLNPDNPTFLLADPPVNLDRDKQRFLCSFEVDGHRRLLVTTLDNLSGKTLLENHPVVRL